MAFLSKKKKSANELPPELADAFEILRQYLPLPK